MPLFPRDSDLHLKSVICQLFYFSPSHLLNLSCFQGVCAHVTLSWDLLQNTWNDTCELHTGFRNMFQYQNMLWHIWRGKNEEAGREGKRGRRRKEEKNTKHKAISDICSVQTSHRWPSLFLLHRCPPIIQSILFHHVITEEQCCSNKMGKHKSPCQISWYVLLSHAYL